MSEKKASAKSNNIEVDAIRFDSKEKLERIREIMFGAQIREYSQRFENINRDLARLQEEIGQITQQISEQNRLLSKQITDLEGRQTATLREQEDRLASQTQELENRTVKKIGDLDKKLTERTDDLQRIVREVEESVRAEFRENADSLNQAKVDRNQLGDLLVQLGGALQQEVTVSNPMLDLLDELANELD